MEISKTFVNSIIFPFRLFITNCVKKSTYLQYFNFNIKLSLSIGGTALTAMLLHEMSDSYDEEVHNSWEQEFLDYFLDLEVSQF